MENKKKLFENFAGKKMIRCYKCDGLGVFDRVRVSKSWQKIGIL